MDYKIIGTNGQEIVIDEVLHPGEVLDMELQARKIKKAGFAAQLGLKPANLSELLRAKRHVSAALALKLEDLLGISAGFWLRLQVQYDLTIERRKRQTPLPASE